MTARHKALWLTLHEPREALYAVGALAIRAARLAAGRTQTAETLPGA